MAVFGLVYEQEVWQIQERVLEKSQDMVIVPGGPIEFLCRLDLVPESLGTESWMETKGMWKKRRMKTN